VNAAAEGWAGLQSTAIDALSVEDQARARQQINACMAATFSSADGVRALAILRERFVRSADTSGLVVGTMDALVALGARVAFVEGQADVVRQIEACIEEARHEPRIDNREGQ